MASVRACVRPETIPYRAVARTALHVDTGALIFVRDFRYIFAISSRLVRDSFGMPAFLASRTRGRSYGTVLHYM